jgi:hypothetical protein
MDCSRTCSILRNTHYTTFSEQYLKIDTGSCEYTAARFKHDAKKFTLTLSNSESTKHGQALQGHLTIDGILFEIFLNFDSDYFVVVVL